ncbi:MAG: SDR family NAD(P)-dependent oxidoreductase [Gammaproteobacteria bacterium]|nr:SDR family NAD(P)-dependent oxidoreductase [Gammaproteobacteria bacterium]
MITTPIVRRPQPRLCANRGSEVSAAPVDITAAGVPESLAAQAPSIYGDIDVLMNNSGVPIGMSTSLRTFECLDSTDFARELDLNSRAVINF